MELIIFLLPLLMQVCLVTSQCRVYEERRIKRLGYDAAERRLLTDCIFPFTYKGQTFNECTDLGRAEYWCSTKNKRGSTDVWEERDHWGYCNVTQHCPSSFVPSTTNDESVGWKPSGKKEECGSTTNFQSIVGGNLTKLGEIPYMALLSYGGIFGCGGSIINRWYILTAAHCVDDITKQTLGDLT